MNSKTTGIWFAIAAALFALIFIFQHVLRPSATAASRLLPELRPTAVTSVQVIPSGALEIRADHTNDAWLLTKPIAYPAQSAAIEALLDALKTLEPATRINAAELRDRHNADVEYGFEPPRISLVVESDGERRQLLVGNKTPPGDQVFLRVVGVDGAFVADADWLKFIPSGVDAWRDTTLVDASHNLDWIVLTNGTKVIELRRDTTNHLWRLIRPFPARADTERITDALQHLQTVRVTQFITDDPKADLTGFGLQPADLDLWLGHGTSFVGALHVGKSPTNDPAQVFARRGDWDTVVTTAREPLLPWRASVNDFRDSHLLELTAPVAEIEVQDQTQFTLQRHGSNDWQIVGEKFAADADNVQLYLKALASLRVADKDGFVKDVVTAPDLPTYGLATPTRQITLRSVAGDTNSVMVQLFFGTNQNDEVFVRRADEDFVYAVAANDLVGLPDAAWEFRDRRIWSFNEGDVVQITIHQDGRTRQIIRNGPNKWSLAPGSQGVVNPPALEETTHRLGELTAMGWLDRNLTDPEKHGWNTNDLEITVELKNGEKKTVDFGTELPKVQTALAAVMLEGERWAFVFPPVLYQFISTYLTIPANTP
ncbi:MAG: DUF4340 domain-containing protein [Verrucomicrobiia bacterium]